MIFASYYESPSGTWTWTLFSNYRECREECLRLKTLRNNPRTAIARADAGALKPYMEEDQLYPHVIEYL